MANRQTGKVDIAGLSGNELTAYMTLLGSAPLNGSQLSRKSGIPRANAYDTLRSLKVKGYICETEGGCFIPLPPEEFLNRVRQRCDMEMEALRDKVLTAPQKPFYDYLWTINGYEEVMNKAIAMIQSAKSDLYVQLYPEEARILDPHLIEAASRQVDIKYVSMGAPLTHFDCQVVHHNSKKILKTNKGRIFDLVTDKSEVLVGMFHLDDMDTSPINWAKNNWFVQSVRESIRHDFFHCMMHKIFTRGESLSEKEIQMYHQLENDAWGNE